jgi:hypothetical protein
MASELDLERPPDDDDPTPRKGGRQSERTERRHRANISDRLTTIFDRLADSLEGRGDLELAEMIREDKKAMVGGLVSVTRRAPAIAPAIMAVLSVLEPLIAFGRVFRLLGRSMGDRRAARAEAWEEPIGGEEPTAQPGGAHVGIVPAPVPEDATARPWDLS